jgi:hypothetical protein
MATEKQPPEKTPEEIEAKAIAKNDSEKKKEEEKKEQKEVEKGEHEGKYFVVKGGTCVCDKAEDPTKTAKIKVTSHDKHIINDGKFAVTEDDTTMDPPVATYGKCTLKPSSSGNLPCAPAFLPKWDKTYEKKKVKKATVVTEISTLQCTIGGKITIKKHGQKNTVTQQHSENTNDAEQMLINPAVYKPIVPPAYPSVTHITLKSISDRKDYKTVDSNDTGKVEKVILRQNEECVFVATIGKGNVDLTSWVIYDSKGAKQFIHEQKGTEFQTRFLALGNYRVEGYGKPKTKEFEKGKFDKNYASCSIDVEVIVNNLSGNALQTIDGDTFTRDKNKEHKLRQNFPASCKAKFLIAPNASEIEKLKIYVTDGADNVLDLGAQTGNNFMFLPINTKAKYTIVATYTHDDGVVDKQSFTGVTEGLSVVSITHAAEIIRPETSMQFSLDTTQYNTAKNITASEASQIKWNLNGLHIGNGGTIKIDGRHFLSLGKYVVEAYINEANAKVGVGNNTDKAKDDWHFEVKHNDVLSFISIGIPKVGKTIQLEVDKYVMPPIDGEKTIWTVFGKTVEHDRINITPPTAGKQIVHCKINHRAGKSQSIDVKQAVIQDVVFTDSSGIEIKNTSWGNKIHIFVKQKELLEEDFTIQLISQANNKPVFTQVVNKYNGGLLPIELDSVMKSKSAGAASVYLKISAPKLKALGEEKVFPTAGRIEISDDRLVFHGLLGEENGSQKHSMVDYDKISWFYANTTGIKTSEELTIEIWQAITGIDPKMKHTVKAKPDASGVLKAKIEWNKIPKIKQHRSMYIQVKDKDDNTLYDADGLPYRATVTLVYTPTVTKMAENKSMVKVAVDGLSSSSCGEKYCIKKGDKSELIREINIRLSGFGGNAPTDEFTDRTEKMIKQFQRDYMKIAETGKVCGNVLLAIDDFCSKWTERIIKYKCLCHASDSKVKLTNRCAGYGKGLKNEHPGMHRTLLW